MMMMTIVIIIISLDSKHTMPDRESIWKKLQRLCRKAVQKDLSALGPRAQPPAVGSKDVWI